MIMIIPKSPIIPTCAKINFMGGEVGGPKTNTTYITTRSDKLIIPTQR